MTKDDINRMMREAGPLTKGPFDDWCKRFANLVAAAEREACARVCEEEEELRDHTPFDCALRIRARGTK